MAGRARGRRGSGRSGEGEEPGTAGPTSSAAAGDVPDPDGSDEQTPGAAAATGTPLPRDLDRLRRILRRKYH